MLLFEQPAHGVGIKCAVGTPKGLLFLSQIYNKRPPVQLSKSQSGANISFAARGSRFLLVVPRGRDLLEINTRRVGLSAHFLPRPACCVILAFYRVGSGFLRVGAWALFLCAPVFTCSTVPVGFLPYSALVLRA